MDEVWTLDNRAGGITIAQLNAGTGSHRLFYHNNTLYSVFALTDETGAITEGYMYDAYGRQSVDTSSGSDGNWFTSDDAWTVGGTSAVGNPYVGLGGYRLDAETGNHYCLNRYYNSGLGRWMSRDPIGYGAGANLYEYCGDAPTGFLDSTGLGGSSNPRTDGSWGKCNQNDPCPMLFDKFIRWTNSAMERLGDLYADQKGLAQSKPESYNSHIGQYVRDANNAIRCWTILMSRDDCFGCGGPPKPPEPSFPPTPPRVDTTVKYVPVYPPYWQYANPLAQGLPDDWVNSLAHGSAGVAVAAATVATGGAALGALGAGGTAAAGTTAVTATATANVGTSIVTTVSGYAATATATAAAAAPVVQQALQTAGR